MTGRDMKLRRKAAGMTQDELAEAMGVTRSRVAHWERGARTVPDDLEDVAKRVLGGPR